jgi:hypothetical protein
MINLIDIVYIIPILLCIVLAYRYLVIKKENRKLFALTLQAEADKDLLRGQILQTIEDKKLVESEEFMMFLNKSREDAFSYIEDVQAAILKFDSAVLEAQIQGTSSSEVLSRILDANKELQKLLPENIKNNNI